MKLMEMERKIVPFLLCLCILAVLGCPKSESPASTEPTAETSEPDSNYIGPHYSHHAPTAHLKLATEQQWDSLNGRDTIPPPPKTIRSPRNPKHKTFGWHLYSKGSLYTQYHFELLWGVAYFSYLLDPATGDYKDIHQWKTTALVDSAKAAGTKVFLTVSNFGASANSTFLQNSTARHRLADSLVSLLHERDADGVNLDFEGMGEGTGPHFSTFVAEIANRLKAENPDWMVTVALYAIDRHAAFEIDKLNPHVDLYTLMAYDYYGSWSKHAGPVSPLQASHRWGASGVAPSVQNYLDKGVPKEKLIVGLPYYGHVWQTENADVPGKAVRSIGSITYANARSEYVDAGADLRFDSLGTAGYVVQESEGTWKQVWFDDSLSLKRKFQWVKGQGFAGVGIWALGYDAGTNALWEVLESEYGE